jgi:hypothetical protein
MIATKPLRGNSKGDDSEGDDSIYYTLSIDVTRPILDIPYHI